MGDDNEYTYSSVCGIGVNSLQKSHQKRGGAGVGDIGSMGAYAGTAAGSATASSTGGAGASTTDGAGASTTRGAALLGWHRPRHGEEMVSDSADADRAKKQGGHCGWGCTRVSLTDRSGQTSRVRYWYTGPVWPETGQYRSKSNLNSKFAVQTVPTGIPAGLTGLPVGLTGNRSNSIFFFFGLNSNARKVY